MRSPRGHELVLSSAVRPGSIVVTVELYCKWYGLYLVRGPAPFSTAAERGYGPADGPSAEEIPFPDWGDPSHRGIGPSFVDHVPNPKAVILFARMLDYHLDELALELMTGRWALEVEQR